MQDDFDEQEQALARRAVDDPGAFQTLYHHYFRRVYGYVAARIAEPLDAEDVVSEIFLRVIKHLPQLRNQQQFSVCSRKLWDTRGLLRRDASAQYSLEF